MYTATLEVRCWKEHTCSACGTIYRYRFTRKKSGQGGTEQAARAAVTRAVITALEREVEMRPCPTCGLYQPEMVGERRARRHWLLVWPVLVILALLIILGAAAAVAAPILSWIALGLAAVVVVGQFAVAFSNPNKSLDLNRERAIPFLDDGTMQVTQKSANAPEPVDVRGGGMPGILLGLTAALVLLVSAELVRNAMGWPVNWDWVPQIVGPGDEPYTYFPDRIESIASHWKGAAAVRATPADKPAAAWLATTRDHDWGNSIRVKSSEKHTRPRLWVQTHIPPQEDLAGKEVRLDMTLHVIFPTLVGNGFDQMQRTFHHTSTLHLAGVRAGRTYTLLWWAGGIGGCVQLVLMTWALAARANSLARGGRPTRTYPVDEPRTESPGAPEPS